MDGMPVNCGQCGAHFMLDPSGDVAGAACSECGGTRFFRSQPSATQSDGALRNMVDSDSQHDEGGNPLGEGTIMGNDGELPRGKRDNYMHSNVAAYPNVMYEGTPDIPPDMTILQYQQTPHEQQCPICGGAFHDPLGMSHHVTEAHPGYGTENGQLTVAKRVEPMRTLNMEPYPPLWDESYAKEAGLLAAPLIPMAGEALGLGADAGGAAVAGGALKQFLPKAIAPIMKGVLGIGGGQQAGGAAPEIPTPAPSPATLSSIDIPFLLMSDMETPHSVKSVDEQHDDPDKHDQHEFNDGDKSPSNMENPNNDPMGADGEDGVRNATEGYGFGPNSPGLDRAMMVLPLLMHYFQSEESGQSDPIIRALHDALEKESPGYLDGADDPDSQQAVQMVIQHHKPQHQAGMNAMQGMPPQVDQGLGMGGGGTCPNCGGVLAGDGTCPQCGHKSGTQFGAQAPTGTPMSLGGGGGTAGGPSYPPNRLGTSGAGPQTPEQKAAVIQLLEQQGRHAEVPQVELQPWLFAKELAEIQGNPNTAPLVDPSQQQPPPPQGMMDPQGAMPVTDPSQMGGGGGQPMQPMARTAGPFNPNPMDGVGLIKCPQCGGKGCPTCEGRGSLHAPHPGGDGYQYDQVYPGDTDPIPVPLERSGLLSPSAQGLHNDPRWSSERLADANNAVPRCPKCQSATTTVHAMGDNSTDGTQSYHARCHACDNTWKVSTGHVILTDLMNPTLQQATEHQHPSPGADSSLTWKDHQGRPLMVGQTYELRSESMAVPEEIKIVSKKPDELGVQLVGDLAGMHIGKGDIPDFTLTPQQIESSKYTFVPSGEAGNTPDQPLGGMPGLEQIPQGGQTTDEAANSYPNPGTVSHVEPEEFDDLCHRCGGDWIEHTASSPTTMMHECARCGAVWESKDQFEDRQASVDLSWLEDSGDDSFAAEMERAKGMREATGGQTRNISTIAARDNRYQAVSQVLASNKMQRESGRHFTPGEQRSLINERGTARNLEDLDLANTHYLTRYEVGNEYNVPDEHLVMGI